MNKSNKRESKKHEELVSSSPKVESVVKKQQFVSIVESVACFGVEDLADQQGCAKLAAEEIKKRFGVQRKALQIREFKFYSQKSCFIHEVGNKDG